MENKIKTISQKILKEYLLKHYSKSYCNSVINNSSYRITECRKGYFVPYDNISMGNIISANSNMNIPVNMMNGVITYSLNKSDTKHLKFTVYEYKEKIMFLKKI
ncbi:hypothetical protein [uncultured Ruminococcus sp.]|uniref:hypothetical protein n=1 Tax=uncultured Ruminococcus sp. TaxID=165186 RepID=UPI0025D668AE|nr:hypothetical protein [uncultured Ruminococcus sp.]